MLISKGKLTQGFLRDEVARAEKLLPFVEGARKAYNDPSWWANFEYFYNEAKKRQLKYQQSKA